MLAVKLLQSDLPGFKCVRGTSSAKLGQEQIFCLPDHFSLLQMRAQFRVTLAAFAGCSHHDVAASVR